MMGPSHRLLGAFAGVSVAALAGQDWSTVAMSGLVASATAHGWASPDIDQTKLWVKIRQRLSRDAARMMGHRILSHWWGLPVIAWIWTLNVAPDSRWAMQMLVVGWASHLVGDFVFGHLPTLPWGGPRMGLGLDTGGFLETGTWGRRRVLPFSPARVLIGVSIAWVLFLGVPTATTGGH